MPTDWYPQSMDARATWHSNFAKQLPDLATKYNITVVQLANVTNENAWIQYWVQARHDGDNLKQQLTKYINTIAGTNPSDDPPAPVNFALAGGVPGEVAPGIEFRTREIARQIKGTAIYADADGQLLGIVGSGEAGRDLTTITPDFTLRTLAAFELEATFKKQGMDALKFQFRRKGGEWQSAGFLLNSPGSFAVAPTMPGVAEQIEIRAIYMLRNDETGNFSDAKSAFIAP